VHAKFQKCAKLQKMTFFEKWHFWGSKNGGVLAVHEFSIFFQKYEKISFFAKIEIS